MTFTAGYFKATKTINKSFIQEGQTVIQKGFSFGEYEYSEFANLSQYAEFLENLTPCEAVAMGCPTGDVHTISPQSRLSEGTIARTKNNFEFIKGATVLTLDVDADKRGNMLLSQQAVYEAFTAAFPDLATAPMLIHKSSSSRVLLRGMPIKEGGWHVAMLIDDGRLSSELVRCLYDQSWLAGLGYCHLTGGKVVTQIREYSQLIDVNAIGVERLVYKTPLCAGDYSLGGLDAVIFNEGSTPLNVNSYLAKNELCEIDAVRKNQLVSNAKRELRPAQRKADDLILDAAPNNEARKRIIKQREMVADACLPWDFELLGDDGRVFTVCDIFESPELYHGVQIKDPLEPDYQGGKTCAIIFTNKRPFKIVSQAHGVHTLTLVAQSRENQIEAIRQKALKTPTSKVLEECAMGYSQEKATPFHTQKQGSIAPTPVSDIDSLMMHIRQKGSVFGQAPMGAGKSSGIIKPLVDSYKAVGAPVLVINPLRSLSAQLARVTGTALYSDQLAAINCKQITTTIHSLITPALGHVRDSMQEIGGLIVIDEAATVADALAAPNSQVRDVDTVLKELITLAQNPSVKVVLLDADSTPALAHLSQMLGVTRHISTQYNPYPLPSVTLMPAQAVEDQLTKQKLRAFGVFKDIEEALDSPRENAVVCFSDSQKAAQAIGDLFNGYRVLVIDGDSREETPQQAFINDPDSGLKDYDLVVYSPCLMAGFSCTSPVRLFGFLQSGVLQPHSQTQLMRRFRNVVGGNIRISVSNRALHPQSFSRVFSYLEEDYARLGIELTEDAQAFDALSHKFNVQKGLHIADPYRMFVGQLLNSDFELEFEYPRDSALSDAFIKSKKTVKAARNEAIYNAKSIDVESYERFKNSGLTEKQMEVTRHRIERSLNVEPSELSIDVIDACENKRFESRLEHARLYAAHKAGGDVSEFDQGFARLAPVKHVALGCEALAVITSMLVDDCYDLDIAVAAVGRVRTIVGRRDVGMLPSVPSAKDISKTPPKATRWLGDTLRNCGFEVQRVKRDGGYVYEVKIDKLIAKYI